MQGKSVRAVAFAGLLWLAGFIWGSVVFMVPQLKATPSIPLVSGNPWISFPILAGWLPLSYLLAWNCLRGAPSLAHEGWKLGLVFAGANLLLDAVVLVGLLGAGGEYFASVTVWVGYLLLLVMPRFAAYRMSSRSGA